MTFRWYNILLFFCTLHCFGQVAAPTPEEGIASYYHARFHGRMTSSGVTHDKDDMVAAHRTLPFGTLVRVTNLNNDKSVIVEITDRGPRSRKRVIDLSRSAAEELDFIRKGIAKVRLEVVTKEMLERDKLFLELLSPKIRTDYEDDLYQTPIPYDQEFNP